MKQTQLDLVRERTGASEPSVKNFFYRPWRLSTEMKQKIGTAVAEVGYQPTRRAESPLKGVRIGYELPRAGYADPSPVMFDQFIELTAAVQNVGGSLEPFIIDPTVPGVDNVVAGTPEERANPVIGRQAWLQNYATSLAPSRYDEMRSQRGVEVFIVNDLRPDDIRLKYLLQRKALYVALGDPGGGSHTFVETDNPLGIARMVEILRAAGCEKFGHAGFSDDGSAVPEQRRKAVRLALGREPDDREFFHYATPGRDEDAAIEKFAEWLVKNPDLDAVICDSDRIAYLVNKAAHTDDVGRSMIQDPTGLRGGVHRTLMLTGNDNSEFRYRVEPAERWMTMVGNQQKRMQQVVALLAGMHEGRRTKTQSFVPPNLIGAPGQEWDDVLELPVNPVDAESI